MGSEMCIRDRPNELIIAPLNRRGFRDIDTTKPYELIEVKNLEELSVN